MTLTLIHRRRKTSPIGVDIGSWGVRAAQVTAADGLWTLTQVARATVTTEHEAKTEDPGEPDAPLRRCLRQARFRGTKARVGVSPPSVEFHTLELPETVLTGGGEKVDQVIEHEVARLMTYTKGSVETRHWTLPSTTVPAPNAIGVVALREAIDDVMGLCQGAGLVCEGVDTVAGALSRFGRVLHRWGEKEVWGLLDLGKSQARLVLCVSGTPVLVRSIGEGGKSWTELIAESLQISFKAAEVHKQDHGVALTVRGMGQGASDAPASELSSIILGVLRSELNKLATEVKRSYEYVLGCYPQRRAADLILVGGGALMRNVAGFMSQALGINVHGASSYVGQETCRLQCSLSERDPLELYAIAIGLALEAEEGDV